VGRKQANPKRDVQLLLRLTSQENVVLDSLAHLEGTTVAALLYRLAQGEVARAEKNEFVRADIANKLAFTSSKAGEVVDLGGRRRDPKSR
jgi:hypothetical protein